jgi:hypothetical protein
MKRLLLLFSLLLTVSVFSEETKAQCVSYFQSTYNSSTGDVDFTALCTYDTTITPILFQWDFGDGNGGYGNNLSHHYTTANGYLVCLILWVGNGPGCCQDTFCELVDFAPTAIEKNKNWITEFAVNSAGNNVKLFLTLEQNQRVQMSLVMMTGQVIPVHVSNEMRQGRNEIDLDLPGYPPGIYLIRIEDALGNSVSRRFMIY